jgi:murein DD-endopeptidase MepM/ murein hydrolase activator NlpD
MGLISPLPRGWRAGAGVAGHMERPLGNWHSDNALDMMARPGTPCYAVDDGRIDPRFGFGWSDNGATVWGFRFTLTTDDGVSCFYQHLGRLARGVAPGARVRQGQLVGWVGNPSRFEAHLHFGARPPANPERIAAGPVRPETVEDKLRLRSGFGPWRSWLLGRGEWRRYGRRNPRVRPDVPAKIPRAWWRRVVMGTRPAPSVPSLAGRNAPRAVSHLALRPLEEEREGPGEG